MDTIEIRLTKTIAMTLRGACSWLDAPMVVPATMFTSQTTIFSVALPLAVLLVTPSLTWLVCGLVPCLAYALLALAADRAAGGVNKSALARAGDFMFLVVWGGTLATSNTRSSAAPELVAVGFAGCLLAQRVNQVLKKLVRRPRPPKGWSERFSHRGYWTDVRGWSVNEGVDAAQTGSMPVDAESFPSGDAAQAGVMSVLLYLYGYGVTGPTVLSLLVAFGRTYFGCHWLFCSVVGAVQGAVTTLLLAYGIGWYDRHQQQHNEHLSLSHHGGTLMLTAIVAYYASAEVQKLFGLK